jgi:hypothetical protein
VAFLSRKARFAKLGSPQLLLSCNISAKSAFSASKSRLHSLLFAPQQVLIGSQSEGEGDSNEEAVARSGSVGGVGGWTRGSSRSGAQSACIHPASGSASADLYRLLC